MEPADHAHRSSSTAPKATTPTLLRILHHLTANASSNVADALDQLSEALEKHPSDAAALRHARHRITRLFASFLKHFYSLPPAKRLSKPLIHQLTNRFNVIADDIGLSDPVMRAIRHAIRAVTTCGFALHLIRSKYAELTDVAPPPPSQDRLSANSSHSNCRFVRHYKKLFRRMLRVADEHNLREFDHLVQLRDRMESRGVNFPPFSRSLCSAVEKVTLHVVKNHASREPGRLEHHAVHALGASVARKFNRRGFHEHFTEKLAAFVRSMAIDEEVVLAVSDWSRKKKARRLNDRAAPTYSDDGRLRRFNSERAADYEEPYRKRRGGSISLTPKERSRSFEESPLLGARRLRSPDVPDRAKFLDDFNPDFDDDQGFGGYRADSRYDGGDHQTLAQLADMPVLNPNPYSYPDSLRARPPVERYEDRDHRDDDSDSSSANSNSTSRSQWARVRRHRRAVHDDPRRHPRAWSAGEDHSDDRRVLGRRGRSRSPKELYGRKAEWNTQLGARRYSQELSDLAAPRHPQGARNSLAGDRFAQFSVASDEDGRGRTDNSLASRELWPREGLGKLTSPEGERWW